MCIVMLKGTNLSGMSEWANILFEVCQHKYIGPNLVISGHRQVFSPIPYGGIIEIFGIDIAGICPICKSYGMGEGIATALKIL